MRCLTVTLTEESAVFLCLLFKVCLMIFHGIMPLVHLEFFRGQIVINVVVCIIQTVASRKVCNNVDGLTSSESFVQHLGIKSVVKTEHRPAD